jgi:large subunit ribosomal protein L6
MSRIGKKIASIPENVTLKVADGCITVKGPRGELTRTIHPLVTVTVQDNKATVSVANEEDKFQRSLWGTFSSHIHNMVQGVTDGFTKKLEVNGVGYRVAMQGTDLKIEVGYSHPVMYALPDAVKATVEKNLISLESFDKDLLGRVAAEIRSIRKPEPYKGKGIKYSDEIIRRKAGKSAKSAA